MAFLDVIGLKESTLEEKIKDHFEFLIPYNLGIYLNYVKRSGIQITSLEKTVVVRAKGKESENSLVDNWEQKVTWALKVFNKIIKASRSDNELAFLILKANDRIRNNEKAIIKLQNLDNSARPKE